MLVNDTLKAFSFQILTGPIYSIFPDWIPWSSLCKGVFPFLFWSSPSGFHSAAPSTFLSGNKGKWRQRHHKQQVLAGSSCQWNDSFGLLRHGLGRLLTISFHVDFCVLFSVTWVLILLIVFLFKMEVVKNFSLTITECSSKSSLLIVCNVDVDECITGNHDCDVNADCTNTVGGHNCTCREGFGGDGRSCTGRLI